MEIGSQSGEGTARILELCGEIGAHLDVIDPVDIRNLDEIRGLLEAHGTFHKGLSLDVLPTLPSAEAYLVDGDHNWFTVYDELELIHAATASAPGPGPIIILHDVEWPYARRDLYYAPENVPEEGRHTIVKGGLRPGRSEVVPEDGLNAHLHHADHEGGDKNGVRTAVEDFLAEHPGEYRFVSAPGINGLGFVFRAKSAEAPFAARAFSFCSLDPAHRALIETMEAERLSLASELEARHRRHEEDVRKLQEALRAHDAKIGSLERKLASIVEARGYQALERVRAVRRRLKK